MSFALGGSWNTQSKAKDHCTAGLQFKRIGFDLNRPAVYSDISPTPTVVVLWMILSGHNIVIIPMLKNI